MILDFLLGVPTFLLVLILSIIITFLTTLIYKWTTDQQLMKQLKEDTKKLQQQVKENKQDANKVMELNQKLMQIQSQTMKQSMKPMIYSMILFLLVFNGIFGWMQTHRAYTGLNPGKEFSIEATLAEPGSAVIDAPDTIILASSKQAEAKPSSQGFFSKIFGRPTWTAEFSVTPTKEGPELISITLGNTTATKEILITNSKEYRTPTQTYQGSIKSIRVHHEKLVILDLGLFKLGWLGTYLVLSIVISLLLRKVMKVY